MSSVQLPDIEQKEERHETPEWTLPRRVVVHNCACHTFDQVILALMKSLPITVEAARDIAMLVHLTGAAVVYEGDLEKCELVANSIIAWAGPGSRTDLPLKVTVEE